MFDDQTSWMGDADSERLTKAKLVLPATAVCGDDPGWTTSLNTLVPNFAKVVESITAKKAAGRASMEVDKEDSKEPSAGVAKPVGEPVAAGGTSQAATASANPAGAAAAKDNASESMHFTMQLCI